MKKRTKQAYLVAQTSTYTVLICLLVSLVLSGFGLVNPFNKVKDRWTVPVTESESSALAELKCVERFLKEIPEGSQVRLSSNAGPYWEQRFHEIAFPRISVINTVTVKTVFLESQSTPNTSQQCGSVFLGVGISG